MLPGRSSSMNRLLIFRRSLSLVRRQSVILAVFILFVVPHYLQYGTASDAIRE